MRVPRRRRRRRRLPDWAASAGAPSAKTSVLSASRIRPIVGAPASSYVTALHRKPLFVTELSSKPASTLSLPPGRLPAASWVLPRRARLGPRDAPHRRGALGVAPPAALHPHVARELGPHRARRARRQRQVRHRRGRGRRR